MYYSYNDVRVATRDSLLEPWQGFQPVFGVNRGFTKHPSITADGLTMVIQSDRHAGAPGLWMTERSDVDAPWSTPVNLGPMINSPMFERDPEISGRRADTLF